jgi:hypothetical protein
MKAMKLVIAPLLVMAFHSMSVSVAVAAESCQGIFSEIRSAADQAEINALAHLFYPIMRDKYHAENAYIQGARANPQVSPSTIASNIIGGHTDANVISKISDANLLEAYHLKLAMNPSTSHKVIAEEMLNPKNPPAETVSNAAPMSPAEQAERRALDSGYYANMRDGYNAANAFLMGARANPEVSPLTIASSIIASHRDTQLISKLYHAGVLEAYHINVAMNPKKSWETIAEELLSTAKPLVKPVSKAAPVTAEVRLRGTKDYQLLNAMKSEGTVDAYLEGVASNPDVAPEVIVHAINKANADYHTRNAMIRVMRYDEYIRGVAINPTVSHLEIAKQVQGEVSQLAYTGRNTTPAQDRAISDYKVLNGMKNQGPAAVEAYLIGAKANPNVAPGVIATAINNAISDYRMLFAMQRTGQVQAYLNAAARNPTRSSRDAAAAISKAVY